MKHTHFEQANSTLSGGPAKKFATQEAVADLPVCRVGGPSSEIISCWKPSWKERLRIILGCRVWLRVATTTTHAPVSVEAVDPWNRQRRSLKAVDAEAYWVS